MWTTLSLQTHKFDLVFEADLVEQLSRSQQKKNIFRKIIMVSGFVICPEWSISSSDPIWVQANGQQRENESYLDNDFSEEVCAWKTVEVWNTDMTWQWAGAFSGQIQSFFFRYLYFLCQWDDIAHLFLTKGLPPTESFLMGKLTSDWGFESVTFTSKCHDLASSTTTDPLIMLH